MPQSREITLAAGPCAVESEPQILSTAYNLGQIAIIAKPYGINTVIRGGCWKPRTERFVMNGHVREEVYEGSTFRGLIWLANAGRRFGLPVVSELMSEEDIKFFDGTYTDADLKKADFGSMKEDFADFINEGIHFGGLDPSRDYIQIGARTSKAYALLHRVGAPHNLDTSEDEATAGKTTYGVVLKHPEHGVLVKDAEGSLQRLEHNREIIYCTRGSLEPIHPSGVPTPEHKAYVDHLRHEQYQHPDARNLNTIKAIQLLREKISPKYPNVKYCHDPSHTWGGKNHEMVQMIGEYAIRAITEFGYDWIMVEVEDRSKGAKCDAAQALLTTKNGVDWSQTEKGKPPKGQEPITLVDIVGKIMEYQVSRGIGPSESLEADRAKLQHIKWGAMPV